MRLIDADLLKTVLVPNKPKTMVEAQVLNVIDESPTIDAAPVRRGEWIDNDCIEGLYSCSECGIVDHRDQRPNFCPNCGADMRGTKQKEG